jgi:hypothetical protein
MNAFEALLAVKAKALLLVPHFRRGSEEILNMLK